MIGSNEVCSECNSLGINKSDSEVINERPLLGLKDKIIHGDELLTTEGSPDLISDGIRL